MKARGLSIVVVIATLSGAAVAVAQQPDPADEPDAAPSGDEAPESGAPPSDAPPLEAAPAPAAQAAAPSDDTHFGFAGQITISDDLEMVAARVSTAGQSGSSTDIQLRPAVDFFAIPNLSIGGQLIIGYTSIDDIGTSTSSTELGLLVRVGYNVAITDTTSIWPRLALGYDHLGGGQSGGSSQDRVPFEIFVPIVVQPAAHFFIGGGPFYSTTLRSQSDGFDLARVSTLGLRATLGGYFRGL